MLLLRHVFKKCYLGKGRILYLSIWPLAKGRQYVWRNERWYLFLERLFYLPQIFFLRLWLRKRSILKSFSGTKKVFFLWIFFWKKYLRQCLLSRRMHWTNTCVTKKENSWVVVFFRFIESGNFFSPFYFSFCLFCCPKMETVFRVVIFLFVSQFRRCHAGSRILVFQEMVNFSNTIYFRQHKWIRKLLFNNTTKKGLL